MDDKLIKTWVKGNKDKVFEDHTPLWLVMIDEMYEKDLSEKNVLDFGCGDGGFLSLLFAKKPFKWGVGIDVATEAIKIANKRKGNLPIKYEAVSNIGHYLGLIDIAFSHEVLYLIEDLNMHAKEIYQALKEKGVYYVVIGCHINNPLWRYWKHIIERFSNIKPQSYTLDEIANTFRKHGFTTYARKLRREDFIQIHGNDIYFPTVLDSLNYYSDYKILFRFVKEVRQVGSK